MATAKKTADKETKVTKTAAKAKTEAKAEAKAEPKAAKTTKAAKAKETVNVTVQFQGKDTSVNEIVETIKNAYVANGNTDPIEKIDIYVQPENNKAYFVVNDTHWNEPVEF